MLLLRSFFLAQNMNVFCVKKKGNALNNSNITTHIGMSSVPPCGRIQIVWESLL